MNISEEIMSKYLKFENDKELVEKQIREQNMKLYFQLYEKFNENELKIFFKIKNKINSQVNILMFFLSSVLFLPFLIIKILNKVPLKDLNINAIVGELFISFLFCILGIYFYIQNRKLNKLILKVKENKNEI